MSDISSGRLDEVAPEFAELLRHPERMASPDFTVPDIKVATVMVPMRDGIRLATDVYLPPKLPAPTVVMRTPYERDQDSNVGAFLSLARRGFAVVSQDCRGTGGSEPDFWDYYVREPEDSYDLIEWITHQDWFDGFIGSTGGSYVGQTQWCMAMHPAMSATVPEVSGLGVGINHLHLHMFVNAYARSMGNGDDILDVSYEDLEGIMLDETLATGYFNEPLYKPLPDAVLKRVPELPGLSPYEAQQRLWAYYCSLTNADRVEVIKEMTGARNVTIVEVESLSDAFGHTISHDRHTLPHTEMDEIVRSLHAPALMVSGWYDWGLNDLFATWDLLNRAAPEPLRSRNRMLIAPSSHGTAGYHEGREGHPELDRPYRTAGIPAVLARWYSAVREDALDSWPTVVYYLMGANEWRAADSWPIRDAEPALFYLGPDGALTSNQPQSSEPDSYTYDPDDPPPTKGGSIVSYVYPPGSVDVSDVQQRSDVLTYTTEPLERDLDVVGPLRMILFASSSAVDTDFVGRLTDVFPDGRAIQLQAGALRTRYRDREGEPSFLEPGHVYRLEIDMWATANRFKAGHRLRVDISSADFPRFDRNTNLGGEPGEPIPARQTIYHDAECPSHLEARVLPRR
ncbi:MAG TPA: CocE/NonD family hydrolase [Streptosporangiaceae bacterium]|nr:CocE/NonD family hydrolase [Streptosporangiaceae bacterium]